MEKFKRIMTPILIGFGAFIGMLALVVGYVWITGGFNERYEPLTSMSFEKDVYLIDGEDTILINPLPEDSTELEVVIEIRTDGIITLPEKYSIGSPIKITPITTTVLVPVLDENGNKQYDENSGTLIVEEKTVNVGGVTKLLAYTPDWEFTAETTIIVDSPVEYFELDSNAPDKIYPGAEFDVFIKENSLLPANSLNPTSSTNGFNGKTIVYESSNETIATVDANGHVIVKTADETGAGQGDFTITAYVVSAYKSLDILPKESDYENYEYEEYLKALNEFRSSATEKFHSYEINVSSISISNEINESNPLSIDLNSFLTITPQDIGLKINPQIGSPYSSDELTHYFRDIKVRVGLLNNTTLTDSEEYVTVKTVSLTDYPYVSWTIEANNYKEAMLGMEFKLSVLKQDYQESESETIDFTAYAPIKITKKQVESLTISTPAGQDVFSLNIGVLEKSEDAIISKPDDGYWNRFSEVNQYDYKILENPLSDSTLQTNLEGNTIYNLFDYYTINPSNSTYNRVKFFVSVVDSSSPAVISTYDAIHRYNNFLLQEVAGLTLNYVRIGEYRLGLTSGVIYPLNSGTVQVYALVVRTDANGNYKYQTVDGQMLFQRQDDEGNTIYYYIDDNGQKQQYDGAMCYAFDYMSSGINVTVSEYLEITEVDVRESVDSEESLVSSGTLEMVQSGTAYVVFNYNLEPEFKKAFDNGEITYSTENATVSVSRDMSQYFYVLTAKQSGETVFAISYKGKVIYSININVLMDAITDISITPNYEKMRVQIEGNSGFRWSCVDSEGLAQASATYQIGVVYYPNKASRTSVYLRAYLDENCTLPADKYITIQGSGDSKIYAIKDGVIDVTILPLTINKVIYLQAYSASDETVKSNVITLTIEDFQFKSITYNYTNTADKYTEILSSKEESLSEIAVSGSAQNLPLISAVYDDEGSRIDTTKLIKFRLKEIPTNVTVTIKDNKITVGNINSKTKFVLVPYTDFGYVFDDYDIYARPALEVDLKSYSNENRIQMVAGSSITIVNSAKEINTEYLMVKNLSEDKIYALTDINSVKSSTMSDIYYDSSNGTITASQSGITTKKDVDIQIVFKDGYSATFYVQISPIVNIVVNDLGKVYSYNGTDYEKMFPNSMLSVENMLSVTPAISSYVISSKTYQYKISLKNNSDWTNVIETNESKISIDENGILIAEDISNNFEFFVRVMITINNTASYPVVVNFYAVTQSELTINTDYANNGAEYKEVPIASSNSTATSNVVFYVINASEGGQMTGSLRNVSYSIKSITPSSGYVVDNSNDSISYIREGSSDFIELNKTTGEVTINKGLTKAELIVEFVYQFDCDNRTYQTVYKMRIYLSN